MFLKRGSAHLITACRGFDSAQEKLLKLFLCAFSPMQLLLTVHSEKKVSKERSDIRLGFYFVSCVNLTRQQMPRGGRLPNFKLFSQTDCTYREKDVHQCSLLIG